MVSLERSEIYLGQKLYVNARLRTEIYLNEPEMVWTSGELQRV